jgi:hypothetical protein
MKGEEVRGKERLKKHHHRRQRERKRKRVDEIGR